MIISEGVTLTGCTKQILALAEWIDQWAKSNKLTLTINSGYRSPERNKAVGGSPTSAHVRGLAIDFNFDTNIFKVVTALYNYWRDEVGPWKGATEFEVCRGRGMQHIHVAFVPDKEKVSFTGTYS